MSDLLRAALYAASSIDVLRLVSSTAWGIVLATLSGSIWRVLAARARFYDVLWALIGGFGLMTLGFSLRWYIAAESTAAYAGLYVYSIALAVLTIRTVRSYGRAHHG